MVLKRLGSLAVGLYLLLTIIEYMFFAGLQLDMGDDYVLDRIIEGCEAEVNRSNRLDDSSPRVEGLKVDGYRVMKESCALDKAESDQSFKVRL